MGRRPPCPTYCECPCHAAEGAGHNPAICPPPGSAKWRFMQVNPSYRKFPLGHKLQAIRDKADSVNPGTPQAHLLEEVNQLLDAVDDVLQLPAWTGDGVQLPDGIVPELVRTREVKRAMEDALDK